MTEYELFAKRGKNFKYDVLEYDFMPSELRIQIHYIWKDALVVHLANRHGRSEAVEHFDYIRNYLCRELGLEKLYEGDYHLSPSEECEMYLKDGMNMEKLLSLIEFSIVSIERFQSKLGYHAQIMGIKMDQQDAIDDLNTRFRENGFGYEFTNGMLIRKDSEILHEEVVKPALHLLQIEGFDGALEEFLKAHDHYRKGNYGDSILYAGKAFESTMKTIGHKEAWGLTGKENASTLISLLINKQVIPSYLQNTLIGLATLRNTLGGHGQGPAPVPVEEHFVNYGLHLCGTNIVMLIEAYKDFSK